ncbi:MAG: hypothetical protein JSS75_05965 [Bacteroidetes bacterium]|nr:hypothetical protein [Bacteroidota bacterium]
MTEELCKASFPSLSIPNPITSRPLKQSPANQKETPYNAKIKGKMKKNMATTQNIENSPETAIIEYMAKIRSKIDTNGENGREWMSGRTRLIA